MSNKTGFEALNENMGPGDEFSENPFAAFAGNIEGNAALTEIHVLERATCLGARQSVGKGSEASGGVSKSGGFDLDHVGALVGEESGRERAGDALG